MISRALDAGIPAAWVTGDEVYGAGPGLRAAMEHRQTGYVLAIAASTRLATPSGRREARQITAALPKTVWQRYSAGHGSKGERYYDWAWTVIDRDKPGKHWLLIRRHHRTGEMAYYRCYAPGRVPLPALVKIAGRRWTTEENFQAAKTLTGLDQHQVRNWTSWHRWTTLAMLALAFLTSTAAEHARPPAPAGLIPLTRNETARLLTALVTPPARGTGHQLRWSHWRRRHQHRAKTSHYQRRAREP